jgi:hypothetical protein
VSIPSDFTIKDLDPLTRYTGTTTLAGDISNGECTLTDTLATFTNVYPGDIVHNTTDGSHGVVIVKTSNTALVTCLFGGTNNEWTLADAYIIVPKRRYKLIVDPPSLTSGHTITVPYVPKPTPVYSLYRSYNLPSEIDLASYAAWLYRYKDREPNFGDTFYKVWDASVRRAAHNDADATRKKGFRVNLIKPTSGEWSYK